MEEKKLFYELASRDISLDDIQEHAAFFQDTYQMRLAQGGASYPKMRQDTIAMFERSFDSNALWSILLYPLVWLGFYLLGMQREVPGMDVFAIIVSIILFPFLFLQLRAWWIRRGIKKHAVRYALYDYPLGYVYRYLDSPYFMRNDTLIQEYLRKN